MSSLVGLYASSLGKKVLMAVTGIILFLYVVAHMLGNLQIFMGPEQINRYAELLHANLVVLWGARLVLLFSVGVHILAAVQLWLRNRASRPVKYRVFRPPSVDYAARTMMWSGPIIAAFVVYHLLQFTTGTVLDGYQHLKPYENVILGFSNPLVAISYIVAILLLCFHLYHGLWSLFQTFGWEHPQLEPWRRRFAVAFAVLIGIGFCSVPLAVLTGVLH